MELDDLWQAPNIFTFKKMSRHGESLYPRRAQQEMFLPHQLPRTPGEI